MDKIVFCYNPMTLQKSTAALVLLMFTVMCAIPAAGTAVPSAVAQEVDDAVSLLDDDDDNLASDITSDVLDSSSSDDDEEEEDSDNEEETEDSAATARDGDTNTQLGFAISDQDQRGANLAAQLGLDVDIIEREDVVVVEEEEVPPTEEVPPAEEEPPEFVAFCVEGLGPGSFFCFDTLEECEEVVEIIIGDGRPCEGFETLPPGAAECEVIRDEQGQPLGVACTVP